MADRSGKVVVRKATPEERKRFGIDVYQKNGKKKPVRSYDDFEEDFRQMEQWARNGFCSGFGVL